MLFIRNVKKRVKINLSNNDYNHQIAVTESEDIPVKFVNDEYIVTTGKAYKISKYVTIQSKSGLVINLSENDLAEALNYFYLKASLEIRHFLSPKLYTKISYEDDGILYYKGRILRSQKITEKGDMSKVMLDLSSRTFQVPLTDSMSPFAYSIVNEIHWFDHDAMHSGVETVLRYTQKYAHIINGRELVKKFKKSCIRCRVLDKKALKISMGPIKDCNMSFAPAFYASQVDLCGPFNSFSIHNKRATVNIWLVVFCCCTTGVNISVLRWWKIIPRLHLC